MYDYKLNSQHQEQVSYQNISQYLYNQSQISQFEKNGSKQEVNLRRVQPLAGMKRKLSQQEKIMGDKQQSEDSYQPSENQKNDQQQSVHNPLNKRRPFKSFNKKESKNKLYAQNYRQKKKEKFKFLQEQNRFLKSKIDDLSFRLKQTEIELNKLKHNNQPYGQSYFQSTRESLLKQINEQLLKQDSQIEKLIQLQRQLKKISAFDSKHRVDLLNYFMSELLENLINDICFYFIDNLIQQKGLWKLNLNELGKQMDYEICEILRISNFEGIKKAFHSIPKLTSFLKNYKNLWKALYQDYLKIIHQGNIIQSLFLPLFQRRNKQNFQGGIQGSLKLQLYFQKIKYRKDMRQLRQSWFQQLNFGKQTTKKIVH